MQVYLLFQLQALMEVYSLLMEQVEVKNIEDFFNIIITILVLLISCYLEVAEQLTWSWMVVEILV